MKEQVKEIAKYYNPKLSVRENKKILEQNNISYEDDALLLYLAIYEIDEKNI